MFQLETKNWVESVDRVVEIMNSRTHSATKVPPNKVNLDNTPEIYARLYPYLAKGQQPPTGQKPAFFIGEHVRILFPKTTFTKGDVSKTSPEIYKIARILFHPVIRYKLADSTSQNIITGSYNERELIKVYIPQEQ